MSDSELSSVPSDVEESLGLEKKDGILKFFSKVVPPKANSKSTVAVEIPSPARKKRAPSPEHVYTLADNPDIAVCIIILSARSRRTFTSKTRCSVAEFELTLFLRSSS